MKSVSSRIWTRIAVSIPYDDNHYTTGTSTQKALISSSLLINKREERSSMTISMDWSHPRIVSASSSENTAISPHRGVSSAQKHRPFQRYIHKKWSLKVWIYYLQTNESSVRLWSVRSGFNPRSSHTKDSKIVLDVALLNIQHYKVRIKDKVEQSREWSSAFL